MQIGPIAPSKPQALTLVKKILELQPYNPISDPQLVYSNKIHPLNLSDVSISRLVEQVNNDPIERKEDRDYVLVEGVMDKVIPALDGRVVVAINYNFVRERPLIVVPGFYIGHKPEHRVIEVRLLSPSQSVRFVEDVLLKESSTGTEKDFPYTGKYIIWPGNPSLKARQIKI